VPETTQTVVANATVVKTTKVKPTTKITPKVEPKIKEPKVEKELIETNTNVPTTEVIKSESSVTGAKSNITVQEFKVKSSGRKPSKVLFDHVYFDFNSIELNPSSRKVLDELLKYYGDHKEIQIEIKSFADGFGNQSYNLSLAEQRGKACFDYLVGRGVDQTALLLTPVGQANFLGNNNSFVGRQLNRRVEFAIVGAKDKYETEAMAYVIEPKMTLYSIAKKFNMSVDELKNMNGISAVDIKAYSAIRVKRNGNTDVIAPSTKENLQNGKQEYKFQDSQFVPSNSGNANLESVEPSTEEGFYIVQPSETLYSISKKYNMTADDLKNLNGLTSNDISVGQKLKIK
jgi:outer membrane protein OmpA-like peptidoglycan-associated protein/LysM repeat protein